ncbi:non-specific serine/threonine protein kinase [Ranunculus cassubicifolius]
MTEEYNALIQTNTWTLVPAHPSYSLVGCKWVFRLKQNADGSTNRYKARLVAKGFHQKEGLDYTETFSPVIKPFSIRIILNIALQYNWCLLQLDVSNAFLHGSMKEQVFMSQPPGFIDKTKPNHVCLLNRSIYGLKQAPRAWYERLVQALLQFGFHTSKCDTSLFIHYTSTTLTFILVYVDDIIISGNSTSFCKEVIHHLQQQFPVKELGPLHFFLGIEVTRTPNTIFLHQSKYILDLLTKSNMTDSKLCITPCSSSLKLDNISGDLLPNPTEYRSIVGSLQYLTWTRPEIAYSVNLVAQFMHSPRVPHMTAAKIILRYLKGTLNHGLLYQKSPSLSIQAYSDADWAGCPMDRKSTSGYVIFMGNNPISWSSKKQNTVSRSSTESEYRALAYTATELTWIAHLLQSIHQPLQVVLVRHCDNISAISLCSNPVFHGRSKHIEVDFHYIRELVQQKQLLIQYIPTADQSADILTKALSSAKHNSFKLKLSVCPPFSLRGAIRSTS